jgi:hypothetical protein
MKKIKREMGKDKERNGGDTERGRKGRLKS